MKLKESEYYAFEEKVDKLDWKCDYIPTKEALETIKENPEKFAVFILWISRCHPEPEDTEEVKALKEIDKLRNRIFEITEYDVPYEQFEEESNEQLSKEKANHKEMEGVSCRQTN